MGTYFGIAIIIAAAAPAVRKIVRDLLVVIVPDKGYKRLKEMEEIQTKKSTVNQVKQTLSEKFKQASHLLSKKDDDP